MKVIILLAGFGTRMRPHTWSRPKALMKAAGNTVIGHLLDQMQPLLANEVIFVVGYKGDQIEAWIRENYPQLDAHFVVQEQALGQAHAVALCRSFLEDESEVVVAFGDGVVRAPFDQYHAVAGKDADAVFTVMEVEDPRSFGVMMLNDKEHVEAFVEKPDTVEHKLAAVGINWFRSSGKLLNALDTILSEGRQTLGEYFMADAYQVMLERNEIIRVLKVDYWLDGGKPGNLLDTNARMLGLGHGTEDAIERGYGEGFTVVPPVFIHESAEIDNSVIGPYVHVDAGAKISGCIISNSIIDERANISGAILDHALVGEDAGVCGTPKKLFVGDKSIVEL